MDLLLALVAVFAIPAGLLFLLGLVDALWAMRRERRAARLRSRPPIYWRPR